MYGRGGGVLGASTTVSGVALLPNTGGKSLLTYAAILAIVGGLIIIAGQFGLTVYRNKN